MARYLVKNPPNPCFCGHDTTSHIAGKCTQCPPVATGGNAHAFSPDPPIFDTAGTLSAQA